MLGATARDPPPRRGGQGASHKEMSRMGEGELEPQRGIGGGGPSSLR